MDSVTDTTLQRYVRDLLGEDDVLRRARERSATEDMPPAPTEVGAFLWLAAQWTQARNALEVGTGAGISGVWIVRGLGDGGTLTTIDIDPEHQRLAREAYREAGIDDRVTTLLGSASEVMAGLPDASFDLIFIDTAKTEAPVHLEHALRLATVGGSIIADDVLWHGRVADERSTAPETVGARRYNERIFTEPRLRSVILPFGNGVAVSLVVS